MNTLKKTIPDTMLVLILGFTGFISAADNWIVSPILPAIAKGFNIGIPQVGAILTAYLIPYGFMQPLYGYIGDKFGKAKILQLIVYGLTLGTIGCATATSLWILCIWRIITGFFAAGIIAISLALIGDTVNRDDRHKHVGKFIGFVFLGQGISVGLGGFLAELINWRIVFLIFGVLAIIIIPFLRKLPKYKAHSEIKNGFITEIYKVILTPKGKVIFPMAFFTGFLILGMYSYLGAFLHEVTKLSYSITGLIIMFFGFSCLFTGSILGSINNRVKYKTIILSGLLIVFFAMLSLALPPYWQTGLLTTILLGFGYVFIQSSLATIAFDVSSKNKGLPSAMIGLGLFGRGGTGTAVGSFLLHYYNYSHLLMIYADGVLIFTIITTKINIK